MAQHAERQAAGNDEAGVAAALGEASVRQLGGLMQEGTLRRDLHSPMVTEGDERDAQALAARSADILAAEANSGHYRVAASMQAMASCAAGHKAAFVAYTGLQDQQATGAGASVAASTDTIRLCPPTAVVQLGNRYTDPTHNDCSNFATHSFGVT